MSNVKTAQGWLESLGLSDFLREVFRPGSPLAFLTAQGLRVAQPMLGAFTDRSGLSALDALAERLEACPFDTLTAPPEPGRRACPEPGRRDPPSD